MESYTIVIFLLSIAIGLYPLASKFKIPYPVLLLTAGIAVGFIPGFHRVSINPDVVFLIFLPPMLYDAAYNISFKDFRRNINTISLLAISLIFITTIGIAVLAYFLIPGMSWPLAFVLGAILSPPDAIAASGVTKGLGLPHRTSTILEGESLVNDASALVAFRFAVAAVAGNAFVLWKAGIMFLISLAGGLLVGWIVWALFAFINKKFRLNSLVMVSLNLVVPFVTYLFAESIHVSGVIAVVTVGLIIAQHKDKLSEETRIQSKSIWDIAIFILGGLIFVLIGLEFPQVLKNIPQEQVLPLIGCAFLIFLVALVIRMVTMFWHKYDTDGKIKALGKRQQAFAVKNELILQRLKKKKGHEKKIQRCNKHFERKMERFKEMESLSIKDCIVIGWSGMRGIVSLAAALSLPLLMADGSAFPQRNTIIFLTVVTVIFMLMVQGLGLPLLIKFLKKKNPEQQI